MIEANKNDKKFLPELIDLLNEDVNDNNEEFIQYFKNPENEAWKYKDIKDGSSILHILIEKNFFNLIEQIVNITKQMITEENFKNFINSKDNKGATPFHLASHFGNMKIIKLLLNNGADYNIKADRGLNCLHYSAMKDKITPIYYMLKKYNMDLYEIDNNGNTFFHWACFCSGERIIDFFLNDQNFKVNLKNNEGFIPLQFYIMSQSTNYLKRLILRGADPYTKNKKGENAFDIVNRIYNEEDKKKYIKEILRRKYYNDLPFYIFIFVHFILALFIIFIECPFIEKKYFFMFLIWTLFIYVCIFYFVNLDPGASKINENNNYLLNLIENDGDNKIIISYYCIKCQVRKELHSKHCFYCDRCIQEFDHHCHWLNKCIGKNNKEIFNYLIIILLINTYFTLILLFYGKKRQQIISFEDFFNFIFFRILNFVIKLKIYIFKIYIAIYICAHFLIIPLLYFWLKQKYKRGNNNIINSNSKTECLIENKGIINDETIHLLEDNNNNA